MLAELNLPTVTLEKLYNQLKKDSKYCLGYPINTSNDIYSENTDCAAPYLLHFSQFMLNNLGTPENPSRYKLNTLDFEKEILSTIGGMYKLKDHYGYVCNSGTESNRFACKLARSLGYDKYIVGTRLTHHNINIEYNIDLKDGIINVEHLEQGGVDEIIILNIGDIFYGRIDDVREVCKKLEGNAYIHLDMALYGMMIPFIEELKHINFEELPIDSISISSHEFLGNPIPSSIFLTKHKIPKGKDIGYLGTNNTTLSCSRSGLGVLYFWYLLHNNNIGYDVDKCLLYTALLKKDLKNADIKIHESNLNYIIIDKPADWIVKKYMLGTQDNLAHLIVMPHMTTKIIQEFVDDIEKSLE